jgi:hypothetical protein
LGYLAVVYTWNEAGQLRSRQRSTNYVDGLRDPTMVVLVITSTDDDDSPSYCGDRALVITSTNHAANHVQQPVATARGLQRPYDRTASE